MDTTDKSAARRLMKPSGMIDEDHSAMANMPQGVVMKEYPKAAYSNLGGYKDNIQGIDQRMHDDARKMGKYQSKELY